MSSTVWMLQINQVNTNVAVFDHFMQLFDGAWLKPFNANLDVKSTKGIILMSCSVSFIFLLLFYTKIKKKIIS